MRLAPDLHLFLLDVHHIVSDGWSNVVMSRELIALYAAFAAGRPSPLPPLPLQYADFARRQRKGLSSEILEAQLAYWRGKLGGTLEPLELPTDRPRPAIQTFRGGSLQLEVPEDLTETLRRLAREERASLFMVLLAALEFGNPIADPCPCVMLRGKVAHLDSGIRIQQTQTRRGIKRENVFVLRVDGSQCRGKLA